MLNSGKMEPWFQEDRCSIWKDSLGLIENGKQKLPVSMAQLSGRVIRNNSEHLGSDGFEGVQ